MSLFQRQVSDPSEAASATTASGSSFVARVTAITSPSVDDRAACRRPRPRRPSTRCRRSARSTAYTEPSSVAAYAAIAVDRVTPVRLTASSATGFQSGSWVAMSIAARWESTGRRRSGSPLAARRRPTASWSRSAVLGRVGARAVRRRTLGVGRSRPVADRQRRRGDGRPESVATRPRPLAGRQVDADDRLGADRDDGSSTTTGCRQAELRRGPARLDRRRPRLGDTAAPGPRPRTPDAPGRPGTATTRRRSGRRRRARSRASARRPARCARKRARRPRRTRWGRRGVSKAGVILRQRPDRPAGPPVPSRAVDGASRMQRADVRSAPGSRADRRRRRRAGR